MKKIILSFTVIFILFSVSCKKTEDGNSSMPQQGNVLQGKASQASVPQGDAFTKTEIDNRINGFMDAQKDFHWQWVDIKTLWSAIQNSDHVVAIGYKPAGFGDVNSVIDRINIKDAAWKAVHDAIISSVVEQLNKTSAAPVSLRDIIIEDDDVLPIITFKVTDKSVITYLYN